MGEVHGWTLNQKDHIRGTPKIIYYQHLYHLYCHIKIVEIWFNSYLQNCFVRSKVSHLYNLLTKLISIKCGTWVFFNTLSQADHYWTCACINGEWPESIDSDTMLKLHLTLPYRMLVRWRVVNMRRSTFQSQRLECSILI